MITLEKIRDMAERLPGLEEVRSYGTPGWKVGRKMVARIHQKEDAIVMVVDSIDTQQVMVAADPSVFYLTDHYLGHPMVLVRPTISESEFFTLLENAWRLAGGC